jgi:iron complex outermembrane receptor protein
MKIIFTLCVMMLSYHIINAQNKITGRITDQNSQPLVGATIFLPEINKGTASDINGHYELRNLPAGKVKIQISFIGYASKVETVSLDKPVTQLNVTLQTSVIEAEEVVITGGYSSTQDENAVKIDVLKLNSLFVKSTPNFSEILTQIPGVDMISKGSGVSKPVIRGLSMNDILILNNGVRFENYQYSDHHPLGIDEFGIGEIEIIKGPASLLYGSDAIGGVLNFIKERPAPEGTTVGDYNLQLFSNTLGMTNNFGIKTSSKKFYGGIRIGQKTNADFLQGGGSFAPNTRFNEYSVKLNTGMTGKSGTFKLFYDYSRQNLGLAEEKAIEAITKRGRKCDIFYEQLNTHLLSSQNKIYLGKANLEVNAAYQNTELIHFGEPDVYEIQMRLGTLTYESKLYLSSGENTDYIVGFQGLYQTNTNLHDRETKLLPDATTNNYSIFGLVQWNFIRKLKIQAGIRYDNKIIMSEALGIPDSSDYRSALDKSYNSFSGSFGTIYNISERLLLRANVAAAYRTPNLAELTSNGPHETRYEVGDNNLIPENAYEFDLSMHYHKDNFMADVAGFYNLIDHYIFITPTGDTTASGMYIYKYVQSNSSLLGGEAGLHYHPYPVRWLHLEVTYSYVIGKQKNGNYLPFIPAGKLNFEIRAEKEKLSFLHQAFISVISNTAFDQNHPAPEETYTPGYTLWSLSIGGQIMWNRQPVSIGIYVSNVFDKKYVDHLSTLKEVNLYDPGRNISLKVRIPFVTNKK